MIDLEDLRYSLNNLQDQAMSTRALYADAVDSIGKESAGPMLKLTKDTGDVVSPEARQAIGAELFDCMWNICETATELNMNLGDLVVDGLRRLASLRSPSVLGRGGDSK
jgi:hypothetical protein